MGSAQTHHIFSQAPRATDVRGALKVRDGLIEQGPRRIIVALADLFERLRVGDFAAQLDGFGQPRRLRQRRQRVAIRILVAFVIKV